MAVFVVFEAFYLAPTVVQLDRFVARNQPLAILPTVSRHSTETVDKDLNPYKVEYL